MSDKRNLTVDDQRLLDQALSASTEHLYDIEPASPTDAGAGMPGELFAENAKNPAPGAHVGLPSEEEIADLLQTLSPIGPRCRSVAARILSLIRPAFEAKERVEADARIFKINATSKLRSLEARALSAEAKSPSRKG